MWSESAWLLSATLLLCPRNCHRTRSTAGRARTAVVLPPGLTGRNRGNGVYSRARDSTRAFMENTKSTKSVFPNPVFLTGGGSFGETSTFSEPIWAQHKRWGSKNIKQSSPSDFSWKKKRGGGREKKSLNLRAQTCRLLLNRLRGALALNAAFNIIPSLKLQARWGAKILMILIMTWNGTAASLRMIFLSRSSFHYDIDGELAEGEVERYAKRRHAKASACILVMTLADWLWHTKLPWLTPIIMYPFII